ncbi:MAG: thiolase [Jatrophihabitans sp.]|nr:MAG: thiolase [Jatrophihabitans sp.]
MTVAVVGVAESDLGHTGASVLALQVQAVTRALADAGLALRDVDGLATNGVGRFPTTALADYLGLTPTWVESSFVGGSAFELYLARAEQAIGAGQAEVVVISFASDQRSSRSRRLGGTVDEALPEAQFEAPYAPLYPISYYAMAAQAYLHRYGASREDLAAVAVEARRWALLNPAAFRHDAGPLTVADVLAAPPVSTPLTALDCCLVTDGGGAVVVTSLERARDLRRPPVAVLGCAEATSHTTMASCDDLLDTGAQRSGATAFARAGVQPGDVDLAMLYDSFTITPVLSLEALGLCAPGEAAGFVAAGHTGPGGTLPMNTNGGGLSYCHPGQYGVLLLVEAVRQLRGECGRRQVPGAEVAVAHGTGGILSHCATVVLGADR